MTRKILFTPEPDITAFELATIIGSIGLKVLPGGYTLPLLFEPIDCREDIWQEMSPDVRRHWTVQ